MKLARQALPHETFPKDACDKKWVVFSSPTFKKTKKVPNYLGRYVHRTAIANNSIITLENDHVTFRFQNSSAREWKTMRLAAIGVPSPRSATCSAEGFSQSALLWHSAPDQQDYPEEVATAVDGEGSS